MLVYGVAFVLLVVSTYLLFEGNTKSRLEYVWASMAVSGVTLVVAFVSILVPRRR
jgi:hypothetical protein